MLCIDCAMSSPTTVSARGDDIGESMASSFVVSEFDYKQGSALCSIKIRYNVFESTSNGVRRADAVPKTPIKASAVDDDLY